MGIFRCVFAVAGIIFTVGQAQGQQPETVAAPKIDKETFNRGKIKSAVCQSCHGSSGIAVIPSYPNLQGQHTEYIKAAIGAYKRRERTGSLAQLMYEQADNLSDQDIADISYFYSHSTGK